MKVAIVTEGWHPVMGGGQVHVEQLTKHLIQDHGCSVDVFTRKILDDNGMPVTESGMLHDTPKGFLYRVGPTAKFFALWARICHIFVVTYSLYKTARQKRYDVIHSHALLSAIPAKIVSRLLKIPMVHTIHGSIHLDAGKKGLFYHIEKYFLTKVRYDTEISVSKQILQYKNVNTNVQVIYNGVDLDAYDAVQGIQKYEGLSFLTVGRIDWQKNHEVVLHALSRIDKSLLDEAGFKWRIVGDGPLRGMCHQLVEKYGLDRYIIFMGRIFGKGLIEEYKRNHVFILPSLAEGQPLTIPEAFASSLPIVASDVGANDDFIRTDVDGRLIPAGSIQAVQETIEQICLMPLPKLQSMGEEGYEHIARRYTWKRITTEIYDQYLKLVKSQ